MIHVNDMLVSKIMECVKLYNCMCQLSYFVPRNRLSSNNIHANYKLFSRSLCMIPTKLVVYCSSIFGQVPNNDPSQLMIMPSNDPS